MSSVRNVAGKQGLRPAAGHDGYSFIGLHPLKSGSSV